MPKSGSAQLLALHCISEQHTGVEISAIFQEQVVLPYTCAVGSSAVNLVLGSWYRRGERLKAGKHLFFMPTDMLVPIESIFLLSLRWKKIPCLEIFILERGTRMN